MEIDHRYTWVLPQKAWYIRFYLWVWEASVEDINFCKLFWGYTLLWLAFPYKLLAITGRRIEKIAHAMGRHRYARKDTKLQTEVSKPPTVEVLTFRAIVGRKVLFDAKNKLFRVRAWSTEGQLVESKGYQARIRFSSPGEATVRVLLVNEASMRDWPVEGKWIECKVKVYEHPAPPMRALEGIAMGVGKIIMATTGILDVVIFAPLEAGLSKTKKPLKKVPFRRMGKVLRVVGILTVGAVAIVGLVDSFPGWGPFIAGIATNSYVLLGAGAVGLLTAIILLGIVTGFWFALRTVIGQPVAEGTKRGALSFRQVMVIGYKSVKGNTCPKVEIEE